MSTDDRKLLILSLVVERFIKTGEPVGSKFIAEAMDNTISSATIRNDMAALEEAGYLEQPHASAGRIPTHQGYRVYINSLMKTTPLTSDEKAEIDALFNVSNADPDKILEDAAESLAQLTGMATISTTVIPRSVTVKQVKIIPVGFRTAVILLVASSGVIKNKVFRVDFELTDSVIAYFTDFANKKLLGKSLDEISSTFINSLSVSLGEYARLFLPVLLAIYDLVREINEGQYYFKGTTNILDYKELSASAYDLLSFIEQRHELCRIVGTNDSATQVMIGRESNAAELSESSVIIARYHIGDAAAGAIVVIGPVRMDYRRIVPHIEYFAKTLGKLLSDTYTEQ